MLPNHVAGVLDGRTGHPRYTRAQYALGRSPWKPPGRKNGGRQVRAGALTAQPPARIPVLIVQILSK
jgi:hypothetical protein